MLHIQVTITILTGLPDDRRRSGELDFHPLQPSQITTTWDHMTSHDQYSQTFKKTGLNTFSDILITRSVKHSTLQSSTFSGVNTCNSDVKP